MRKSVNMNSKNPLFNKAFEYAVHGFSVMPLRLDKKPLLGSWKALQEKAADEDQIAEWWKKNPRANIGIITGRISGITVVDIDMSGGKAVDLDMFPKTYTVRTPTGGYHLYYKYELGIGQTANTFEHLPHVDIRNDGGFVVAPPSHCEYIKDKKKISGDYTIHRKLPLAAFPLALFQGPAQPASKATVNSILKGFPKLAEGDGRNVALTKVVGKIVKLVPPKDLQEVGWPLVLSTNAQFKKPLSEKEVKIIFNSIAKKEGAKPLAKVEFIRNKDGAIISNVENLYRTFKADPELSDKFRFNTFAAVIESKFGRDEFDAFQRVDVIRLRNYLMSNYQHFARVAHGDVEDAMIRIAEDNKVSPPAEWLRGLEWDKVPRLNSWLSTVYGTPDDEYHQAVGSNWLKGMVQRIVRPGSKFDYVLVLEGQQGIRKSTSLAVLGGAWHVETVFSPDNKDFFMIFGGKAIVEFSEGETLSRTEAKRLKAVITMQFDKYRPPYERTAKEFPRQCVFAMTTNQEQYLKDETGNRRWLPVAVQKTADVKWLEENREQLFAEAYHRVITKRETTYEFPEEETRRQQFMRQTTDPREEIIFEWYFTTLKEEHREAGITTRMAYQGTTGMGFGNGKEMGKMEEMIISDILRNVLKLEKKRTMEKNSRFYKYFPSKDTMAMAPEAQTIIDPAKLAF